jgi:hypothetical protein
MLVVGWLRTHAYRPLMLALFLLVGMLGVPDVSGQARIPVAQANGVFVGTVYSTGQYRLKISHLGWAFEGTVGTPVTSLRTVIGSDRLGAYQALIFAYDAGGQRISSIRTYSNRPIVLFSTTYLTNAPNTRPFPALSNYPHLPFRLGYSGGFAGYSFRKAGQDSPFIYFNQQRQSFVFSPAANFQVASTQQDLGGPLTSAISSAIPRLPAGFTQWTMLAAGDGINNTIDAWGRALTDLYGKVRRPNDADVTLNTLGYWTDNGAAYYYQFDPTLGYANTLLAVKQYLDSLGIPIGYMQLDSWWYPKGPAARWQGSGPQRGGIYTYTAAADLFPGGLAAFHQALGLPLVTHARWIDPSSPYHNGFAMSNNVVIDPAYWRAIMAYLQSSGVVTYEQDWLSGPALANENLTDPRAFLTNMAAASAGDGLTLQYCLATPGDFLQSVEYGNVTTLRVSGDRFSRSRWDAFLYGSRLADAVGVWPWSDVFRSAETPNLLLSTLSAGMVGIGDRIGTTDVPNLLQAVRQDGVIVKPDAPIVPTDESYVLQAQDPSAPMIASTYTQHGDQLARYVFAYARGASSPISFSPAELGISGPSYVYDYFSKQGTLLPAGGTFSQTVSHDGAYYIVVPIGQSGIGFLGDAGKFVSLGKKRISALSDNGIVQATVSFAASEHAVQLYGYAPVSPEIVATVGTASAVSYDPTTHLFTVMVAPGANGTAQIALRPTPDI